MSSAERSLPRAQASNDAVMHGERNELTSMVYRSRATAPFSEADLQDLVQAAHVRNRSESVTGVLIYDEGRFFQWIEGPADALGRLWKSIGADSRHTDVEVLSSQPVPTRFFGEWNMRLAKRHALGNRPQGDVLETPPDLIDSLCRSPSSTPRLLATLGKPQSLVRTPPPGARPDPSILLSVVQKLVIPHLLATPRPEPIAASAWPAHPRLAELVRSLIDTDPAAAIDLIEQLHAPADTMVSLYATLIEPAGRGLGDLWAADECSEFDVTMGMIRLQAAVRQVNHGVLVQAAPTGPARAVLVAPQPGEPHMLGSTLDADLLWQAGWDTHCEFPTTDEAMESLVADTWFDVLDLSLSTAFLREHWLPRMEHTIAQARSASRNPALVVVVGGRVFVEQGDARARVGADASTSTSLQVKRQIDQALGRLT